MHTEVSSASTQRRASSSSQTSFNKQNKAKKSPSSPTPPSPSPQKKNAITSMPTPTPTLSSFSLIDVLPILSTAFVLFCAFLAYSGHRGRSTVVGIDLGTTYSVIAVRASGGGIGEVEVIRDYPSSSSPADLDNVSPIVPSVAYYPKGRNGPVTVGREAKKMIGVDPKNVIYNAKRFIGRNWDDPAVSVQASNQDFGVVPNTDLLTSNTSTLSMSLSQVAFKLSNADLITPEQVSSHILTHLLSSAQKHLGHSQITSAVIAVPAKFNAQQRQATALAFKLAGLKVTRMLEEPTAAALAYDLHRKPHVHYILVYDFGGGTLDVSVLHVSESYVEVIGSEGDDRLGGADFDGIIAEFLMRKYEEVIVEEGVVKLCAANSEEEEEEEKGELVVPYCSRANMFPLAEKLKIMLSSSDVASIDCRTVSSSSCKNDSATKTPTHLTITKQEFLSLSSDLLQRSSKPIRDVLTNLSLTHEDIDEVVMVGGTSRMPEIRDIVREVLRKETLNTRIDPDVTVAYGCAAVID